MAKVRIIVEDDEGNKIGRKEEREYYLEVKKGTIDEVEEAVDKFRKEVLPEIVKELIEERQKEVVASQKKQES